MENRRGRAAAALACGASCALPLLVVAGVVSLATLSAAATGAASTGAVVWLAVALARGRVQTLAQSVRMLVAVTGLVAATGGALTDDARWQMGLFSVAVALVAAAALLALVPDAPAGRRAA